MERDYIHGFSRRERLRLVEQARILAPEVFRGLDLSNAETLLELGCGVGAELSLIAERWPNISLTGLDLNPSLLSAARDILAKQIASRSAALVRGDAFRLPFADASFDRVITIWMLEHIHDPAVVLAEALRVLSPHGWLICTEVDNSTLAFRPDQPAIAEWWRRFNRFQKDAGGDPFVGRLLGNTAQRLGCRNVSATRLPIISSRHDSSRRLLLLDYLRDLLLSGAENLVGSGFADEALQHQMEREFSAARRNPELQFEYSAVRLTCQPG